jgi:hypothetical protein
MRVHHPSIRKNLLQLSKDNLVISALSKKKQSIRAPQSATIGDALSGDNISLIFYKAIR